MTSVRRQGLDREGRSGQMLTEPFSRGEGGRPLTGGQRTGAALAQGGWPATVPETPKARDRPAQPLAEAALPPFMSGI